MDLCLSAVSLCSEFVPDQWITWLQQLHNLDNFGVTRCMKPPDFGKITALQLHHFCVNSEDGYGSVTHPLLRDEHLKAHSASVMGKARVGPLIPVTIPRLDLTAATMARCIDALWRKELQMNLMDSVLWTDIMSVLE